MLPRPINWDFDHLASWQKAEAGNILCTRGAQGPGRPFSPPVPLIIDSAAGPNWHPTASSVRFRRPQNSVKESYSFWDGSVIKWGGPNPPKSSAVSTYYKVQYFPLLGGHCRSRCRFSPRAHIDADFVEGSFRIRGREVSFNQMWTITDDNKEPLGFLSGYNTFCKKGHPLRLFLKPPGEVPESNQCEYFK